MSDRIQVGDLAIVVRCRNTPELIGTIVGVDARMTGDMHMRATTGESVHVEYDTDHRYWVCSHKPRPEVTTSGRVLKFDQSVFAEHCLKPLRDKPGEDEVLRYAGKPEGVTA